MIFGLASAGGAGFSVSGAVVEFLKVSLGGLAVGMALGYLVSNVLLKHLDDHLIETAITLALAFGAYVAAEQIHVSGILAVVAAGIIVGDIGLQNTSPTTRLSLLNFWELLSFVVNAFVFLLIGLRIDIELMADNLAPILVAVVTILLARAVIIYGTSWVQNRVIATRYLPLNFQHTMYWGGLRGAVSLALALTLIFSFESDVAEVLLVMTFGVVLFTLLVQGTTIKWLLSKVGLTGTSESVIEHERRQGRVLAARAGRRELERLRGEGVLQAAVWSSLNELYDGELDSVRSSLGLHFQANPELETETFLKLRHDLLNAERTGLRDAVRSGLVSEEAADEIATDLANWIAALSFIRLRLIHPEPEEGD